MSMLPPRRGRNASSVLVTVALALGFAVATVPLAAPARASEIIPLPSSGSVTVYGKGNGHGHGMSQYGAQGAAIAGLTGAQIVGFYYPGTVLTNLGVTTIRVLVGGAGSYPTVVEQSGLALYFSGANHALPSTGISRYRLVPSGGGLTLQRLSSTWADVAGYTALPRQADFNNVSTAVVRLARTDGQFNDYRGWLGGYNYGTGVLGHQPGQSRPVHAGRGTARVAVLVAFRCSAGTGDRRPELRAQRGREPHRVGLRHLRHDRLPGVRRAGPAQLRRHPALRRRTEHERGDGRDGEPGAPVQRSDDLRAVLRVQRRLDVLRRLPLPAAQVGPLRQRGLRRPVPQLDPVVGSQRDRLVVRPEPGHHAGDHPTRGRRDVGRPGAAGVRRRLLPERQLRRTSR